jgi:outer membrane lipoprotein SlyB
MRSSTTTTTWVAEGNWARAGTVESVQEVVRRVEGEPVAGALAGALVGGFLFHGNGRASLFGAAAGAAIGAAASQGSAGSARIRCWFVSTMESAACSCSATTHRSCRAGASR